MKPIHVTKIQNRLRNIHAGFEEKVAEKAHEYCVEHVLSCPKNRLSRSKHAA
ncbi:MAG: hypothetical protein RL341_2148 [Pseudomonadota bacterium]